MGRQDADLRLCVHLIEALPVSGVPEADAAVGRPTARREQVRLERAPAAAAARRNPAQRAERDGGKGEGAGGVGRTPGERLHRGLVSGDREARLVAARLPDVEYVVVAARRELRALRRPLEPADLLRVPVQLRRLLRRAHVVVVDACVTAPA